MSGKDPRKYRQQDEHVTIIGDQSLVVPERLLLDTEENAAEDARVWGLISKYSRLEGEMPTQAEIAEQLGRSRPTINTSLQMLRINRWLTVIHDDERDESGQFKRLAYALHTEQVPLETVIKLDPDYAGFLKDKSVGSVKILAKRALEVLGEINRYYVSIGEGIDLSTSGIEPPCKNILHGKHPTTTSTSSTTTDLSPNINTKTRMRFPIELVFRRFQNEEEAIY